MVDKSFQQDVLLLSAGKYDPCLQLRLNQLSQMPHKSDTLNPLYITQNIQPTP